MANIRSVVHQWHKEFIAGNLDMDQQVDLALTLFEGENTEEKLAGTKRVVTKNISHFSVESLNNALKYFEAEEKKFYCQLLKDA